MAFHSEWLRNNPKGPHGPIPPKGAEGALGSPWPLGSPWVPLTPPWPPSPFPPGPSGSPGVPGGFGGGWGPWGPFGPKGSAPCRSEKRASRTLGGGADSAGENILGRRHARKRIWISVACGNSSARGPREESVRTEESCKTTRKFQNVTKSIRN